MQGINTGGGDRWGRIAIVEGETFDTNEIKIESNCFPLVEYEANTCTLVTASIVPQENLVPINASSTYTMWIRTSTNTCSSYTGGIPFLIEFPAIGDPVNEWVTTFFIGEELTFSTSTDPWGWLSGQADGDTTTPSAKMRKWVADQIYALRYNPPQGFFFRAYDLFSGVFDDIETSENTEVVVTLMNQEIPIMSSTTFSNASVDMSAYRTYSTALIYFMFGLFLVSLIKIPSE